MNPSESVDPLMDSRKHQRINRLTRSVVTYQPQHLKDGLGHNFIQYFIQKGLLTTSQSHKCDIKPLSEVSDTDLIKEYKFNKFCHFRF